MIKIISILAFLLPFVLSSYSYADFESSTTPVDMRDYWPHTYSVKKYRRADSSLYLKRITKSSDPMAYWLPNSDPGDIHFSREDHRARTYWSEQTWFDNSWSMVKKANKAVSEVADSFPPDNSNCPGWCGGGRGQHYGNGGAILHGRPGGHTLNENYYYQFNVPVYFSNNYQTTTPTLDSHFAVYTVTKLQQKYNTFTPEYGRSSNGTWGAGHGKTYNNVILMVLQHGTKNTYSSSTGSTCSNAPSGYNHQNGYTSFWVYVWYAKGVGPVQSYILFDERTCDGHSAPAANTLPVQYNYYLDD